MNHGGEEDEAGPRSRRHRHDTDAPEGLSVADLLARHGVANESADGGASRRHGLDDEPPVADEPPVPISEPEDADQFVPEPPEPPAPAEPVQSVQSQPVRSQPEPPAEIGFARRVMLPSDLSANLFAQLGKAPPDDSPTDIVPKVPADVPPPPAEPPRVGAPGTPSRDVQHTVEPEPPAEPEPPVPPVPPAPPDTPGDDERGFELRTQRIDESLTRLTAIHAGLGREMTERVSRTRGLPVVDRTADAAPDTEDDKPPRTPRWLRRTAKGITLAAALSLFLATAAGWGTRAWLDGKLRTVAALDPGSEAIVDPASQAGDQNYLLVGLDPSNPQAGARGGPLPGVLPTAVPAPALAPGTHPGGPGTILLAHVPAKRDRVVMLAFPGDLAVDRPSCDRWSQASGGYPGGTSPAQSGVQLASAYTIGGPRCMTKTIQKLTGMAVNHYTDVDLAGIKDMADAVHGVPICLPKPVLDGQLGPVVPSPGGAVLTGDRALAFARARHVQGDPSPTVGQLQRQQMLLAALLDKAGSDQVLADFNGLDGLVTAFGTSTHSDNSGLEALGALAGSIRTVDPSQVSFVTVPTSGQPDLQGNELLQVEPALALFDAVRTKRPLPTGDNADGRTPNRLIANQLPPRAVTVNIRNASARKGLGNQAADSLRTLGFTVASVGNAPPAPGGRTVIRHSPDRAEQAAALAAAVPSALTEPAPGTVGQLDLVLGDGFDGQVRAAPMAGIATAPSGPQILTAAAMSCD
ncbi:LCP family protein [Pseudonocardia acaciae]|uniref:LCP family protein n=1 Tax=Pseudonocardia acaciae TaxID=551276 RepID=UPI00048FB1EE|nr:LCP family protein [Pseudonocardia acaciae]